MLTFAGQQGLPVDYNVIWLDEDSAIEYDCNDGALGLDYCVHIMSRTPTMAPEKLQQLLEFAGNLKWERNMQNISIKCIISLCRES